MSVTYIQSVAHLLFTNTTTSIDPPQRSSGSTCTSSSPPWQTPKAPLPPSSLSAGPCTATLSCCTPSIFDSNNLIFSRWLMLRTWLLFIIHIIFVSIKVVDIHVPQQSVIYTIHCFMLRDHLHYLIILHCQSYHAISPSQYVAYLQSLGEYIQLLVANRMDVLHELLLHTTLISLVITFIPFVNDSDHWSRMYRTLTVIS